MNIGKACAIFKNINADNISDDDKALAIYMAIKADAYLKYISSLKSHWFVGCCLPRM